MKDGAIVQKLKKELCVDSLSVSEKYPNDDGCSH